MLQEGATPQGWKETSDPGRLVERPLLSVLMLAYNQGRFLEAAIQGVLIQQVDFPFELIIADDASTDDTVAIALGFQRQHPGIIRVLVGDRNVGAQQNLGRVIEASRGELLAFCEGDDYWTASDKLRRQVAVLAARPEVSVCWHAAREFDDRTQTMMRLYSAGDRPADYTLPEVIRGGGGMMPTASIVLRGSARPPLDDWFYGCDVGDYPVAVWAAAVGVCHSLPEVMSIYRTGVSTSWTAAHLGDPGKDWNHVTTVIAMLEALPAKAGRPDAVPAVHEITRRLLRDFSADHGGTVLRRMPGVERYLPRLTLLDRLFIFACNDPRSWRMRLAWRVISVWRSFRRPAPGPATGPR